MAKSRIKSITIRFNMEARPFQHIRVEATATITKDDDQDEVREELVAYTKSTSDRILHRIFGFPEPTEEPQPSTNPY